MITSSSHTKPTRNLRALFFLAATLCALAAGGGGLLLVLGYPHPEVTKPLWQFGQYVMLLGLVNLAVYCGIYWQVRRLVSGPTETVTAQPGV